MTNELRMIFFIIPSEDNLNSPYAHAPRDE